MRSGSILLLLCLIICSCNDDSPNNRVPNESDEFALCNSLLSECTNSSGRYCLFGFKWGDANPFINPGFNATGPGVGSGIITYSFQEENGLVNTHSQINLPSQSFSKLPSCTKTEIRSALSEWEAAANIEFLEMADNNDSDIRFFVVDSRQTGIGYPNYPEDPCTMLRGQVIIKANFEFNDCDVIRKFFLHEIGHVLGLGHVRSQNIMNSSLSVIEELDGLQSGDLEGIVEIYGEK